MKITYPYIIKEEEDGFTVTFPDVPEAVTGYDLLDKERQDKVRDCLVAALGGYIKLGRELPTPSEATAGFAISVSQEELDEEVAR